MDQAVVPGAERVGDWMITYTGKRFYPLDPRHGEICIEDIAHHLARVCRYGGAVAGYYSVAEHSCHLADYFSQQGLPAEARSALMHDASEAYLGDVIRPIKPDLARFLEIEAEVEAVIAEKYGLPHPLPVTVKLADNAIIGDERVQLFGVEALRASAWKVRPGLGITLQQWGCAAAERQFLRRFADLFHGLVL